MVPPCVLSVPLANSAKVNSNPGGQVDRDALLVAGHGVADRLGFSVHHALDGEMSFSLFDVELKQIGRNTGSYSFLKVDEYTLNWFAPGTDSLPEDQ